MADGALEMNLDRLAALTKGHRYLPRGVDSGAAALTVVPALADGLPMPPGPDGTMPAHVLDALAPAVERMLTSLIADLEANVSEPGERDFSDDPFVAALRDCIVAGAHISDAGGALALLQAARCCTDTFGHPPVRLQPMVTRFREGPAEIRGAALAGLARGIQIRIAEACAAAVRMGWRMPAYASDLTTCRLAWIFGRETLEREPQLGVVAALVGVTIPPALLQGSELAVRLVVTDVLARQAARKPRPADQLLLLRWLPPALIALGPEAAGRLATCDPDLVAAVLPQLPAFIDGKGLVRGGVEKALADQLMRPEAGVAAASALGEIGVELRRWDVHTCIAASLERPAPHAAFAVQAYGPRRRILQGAVVAAAARPGAASDRILAAHAAPDDTLVSDGGALALVAFGDPVDAVRWALSLVNTLGETVAVGLGAGRLNGGTDGVTTRLHGPAVQGAIAAIRRAGLGLSAAAAEELSEAAPPPPGEGSACLVDGKLLRLEPVAGLPGVVEVRLGGAPVPRPATAPEVAPEPQPQPPRPMPDLLAPRGAGETTGPIVIPAPLRRSSTGETPGRPPEVTPRVSPSMPARPAPLVIASAPEGTNPFDDLGPTRATGGPPLAEAQAPADGDPFAAPPESPSTPVVDPFWDETPTRVQPLAGPSEAVLMAPAIEIPAVPEFVVPPALAALGSPVGADAEVTETFAAPAEAEAADYDLFGPSFPEAAPEAAPSPAAEDTSDFGTFDFNFDFSEPDGPAELELGGRRVAVVAPIAAVGGERTEDDATHIERVRSDDDAPPGRGSSFELEVDEAEDDASAPPDVDAREVLDGSFDFPFALVEDGAAMGATSRPEATRGTTPAETTSTSFHLEEELLDLKPASPPAPTPPRPLARPAAPPPEPARAASPPKPVEPARPRKPVVTVDFDHLFRGYCFYLDDVNAVFGRPYGGRMVDRHTYPYVGDIEQVYRNFLQDKIREGFVPQTDLTGEVPPSMTLLPLNSDRLQRAWSSLT